MKCRKCGADFDASFRYCPNCGTKNQDCDLAPFTVLEWYMSAQGKKDAENDWDQMRKMSFEELEKHLSQKAKSIYVWTIGGEYTKKPPFGTRYKNQKLSAKFTAIIPQRARIYVREYNAGEYENLEMYPVHKKISKVDLHEIGKEGASTFMTEKECREAIKKIYSDVNEEGKKS